MALFKGPVRATGFADDGALLIKGCDPSSMVDLMQSALKEAVNWGTQNGLHLNPVKTVAMFFHRKNKWTMPKKLEMSGTPLEYSSTTKYLGVHLDTRLNWTFHIEKKITNVKRHILMIRNAIGTMWGPSPRALKWAFNGIIIPSLTYGCFVW